jgi:hypothetical protein
LQMGFSLLCLAGHIEKDVVFETETLNGHNSKFGEDMVLLHC